MVTGMLSSTATLRDPVLHRRDAGALRDRHADRLIGERLYPRPQFLIQLGVHPGSPAHAAGFFYGDVFELDGRRLLGHKDTLFLAVVWFSDRYLTRSGERVRLLVGE